MSYRLDQTHAEFDFYLDKHPHESNPIARFAEEFPELKTAFALGETARFFDGSTGVVFGSNIPDLRRLEFLTKHDFVELDTVTKKISYGRGFVIRDEQSDGVVLLPSNFNDLVGAVRENYGKRRACLIKAGWEDVVKEYQQTDRPRNYAGFKAAMEALVLVEVKCGYLEIEFEYFNEEYRDLSRTAVLSAIALLNRFV